MQAYQQGKCLYFWYHAYGKDVATLNVYAEIQLNSTNNPKTKIWTMTRNQGNEWFIARVPTDYDADYRVIFEGIVGNGYMGDVVSVKIFTWTLAI